MTPFATVGVDVGTSTTKVVLGNGAGDMEAMRYVPLNGACRWPSVVAVHTLRGDIHVFNEHDSTFSPAKVRRNLKLAILLSPEHPELRVVEDHTGWRPDTLYCAMVTFALAKALHEHGPCDGYACFVGAPLRDVANDGRRLKFGQIGYAARQCVDKITQHDLEHMVVPAWVAELIAAELERPSNGSADDVVLAESHAAVSGTALSTYALNGTNCVIDMGAGTTDIGWFARGNGSALNYFGGNSFDVAGEQLDDALRFHISRDHGTRVSRAALWSAKSVSEPLRGIVGAGSDWNISAADLSAICNSHAEYLAELIKRSALDMNLGTRVRFLLVGGATLFQPVQDALVGALQTRFEHAEFLSVPSVPIPPIGTPEVPIGLDAPIWVAMGLARGIQATDTFVSGNPPSTEPVPITGPWHRRVQCTCGGANSDCARCAGRGVVTFGSPDDDEVRPIDTFESRELWRDCNICGHRLAPELLDDHTKRLHVALLAPVDAPSPAMDVDESRTIIEWINHPQARHGIDPLSLQLLVLLERPVLTSDEAREGLRALRPAAAALSDNIAQTQAARAIRALIWQRAGCHESAKVEAEALIWQHLRDYLAAQGIKA